MAGQAQQALRNIAGLPLAALAMLCFIWPSELRASRRATPFPLTLSSPVFPSPSLSFPPVPTPPLSYPPSQGSLRLPFFAFCGRRSLDAALSSPLTSELRASRRETLSPLSLASHHLHSSSLLLLLFFLFLLLRIFSPPHPPSNRSFSFCKEKRRCRQPHTTVNKQQRARATIINKNRLE
jgi:hypothetical protein